MLENNTYMTASNSILPRTSLPLTRQEALDILCLLQAVQQLSETDKILNTFIPAFKNSSIIKDGWAYLHGCYHLGGTKSGRLSSSDPNLTNIPSTGTEHADAVKRCFQTPSKSSSEALEGHILDPSQIMVGADFDGLEDRIAAILTGDPNRVRVYTDGYNAHCLRAYSYFQRLMPDIEDELNQPGHDPVAIINSIADRYPHLRQRGKSPSFALQYQGTWRTLVENFGFNEAEAKEIEKQYNQLYKVSVDWTSKQLFHASTTGYVELAFGLRLRTPMLHRSVPGSYSSLPKEAHKEMKTAGNALMQSYGLLNTRAGNEFMQRVWSSEYRYKILPIAQIHDALYYVIDNTIGCLHWVNINLIDCMRWNALPELSSSPVKLQAKLDVYYPDWSVKHQVPNNLTLSQLHQWLQEQELKKSS